MRTHLIRRKLALLMLGGLLLSAACARPGGASDGAPAGAASGSITVYSGRAESLVGPLIERVTKETGIEVRARYGDTAELAAALLEEGKNSPADVFFAQDAGALGAVGQKGLFVKLPDELLNKVESRFRSPQGLWVGASGRARTVAYNTDVLREQDLPASILGFTDTQWRGRIGWVPTNGSFQAFVTALRLTEGEPQTARWIEGVKANNPKGYANNTAAVRAVASREVDVAFVLDPAPDSIATVPLFEWPRLVAVSKSLADRYPDEIGQRLRDEPIALPIQMAAQAWRIAWTPTTQGSGPTFVVGEESMEAMLAVVGAGRAYCVVPEYVARFYPQPGVTFLTVVDVKPCLVGIGALRSRLGEPHIGAVLKIAESVTQRRKARTAPRT